MFTRIHCGHKNLERLQVLSQSTACGRSLILFTDMMDGKATTVDGRFLTSALNDPTKQSQVFYNICKKKKEEGDNSK